VLLKSNAPSSVHQLADGVSCHENERENVWTILKNGGSGRRVAVIYFVAKLLLVRLFDALLFSVKRIVSSF
jgi:hypothetical protein